MNNLYVRSIGRETNLSSDLLHNGALGIGYYYVRSELARVYL